MTIEIGPNLAATLTIIIVLLGMALLVYAGRN